MQHYLVNVQRNTGSDIVNGELEHGVCPLEVDVNVRMVKYCIRLVPGKPGKFAQVTYQWLMHRTLLDCTPPLACMKLISAEQM